jgi:cytochrome b
MPMPSETDAARGETVVAWDVPTRLFHWTLVTLIAMAWVSRKYGDAGLVWHTWNGYALLVLIVWRLLWGVVGTSTARFAAFVRGPVATVRYGIDFALRRPRSFLGHNPLGGLVVLAMLGLVGLQAGLGLVSYDDHSSLTGGPLSSRVPDAVWEAATRWHIRLFDILLMLIGLHIAANLLYLVWKRENLVAAMISGRKERKAFEDQPEARVESGVKALVCLVVAAVIVFGGIVALGGKVL